MDDAWEITYGLNPSDPDDRNKKTKSEYTCLEVYLNQLVGERIEMEFPVTGADEIEKPATKTFFDSSDNSLHIQGSRNIQRVALFDLFGRKWHDFCGAYLTTVGLPELPQGW